MWVCDGIKEKGGRMGEDRSPDCIVSLNYAFSMTESLVSTIMRNP